MTSHNQEFMAFIFWHVYIKFSGIPLRSFIYGCYGCLAISYSVESWEIMAHYIMHKTQCVSDLDIIKPKKEKEKRRWALSQRKRIALSYETALLKGKLYHVLLKSSSTELRIADHASCSPGFSWSTSSLPPSISLFFSLSLSLYFFLKQTKFHYGLPMPLCITAHWVNLQASFKLRIRPSFVMLSLLRVFTALCTCLHVRCCYYIVLLVWPVCLKSDSLNKQKFS